jgi:hypothetical protein
MVVSTGVSNCATQTSSLRGLPHHRAGEVLVGAGRRP